MSGLLGHRGLLLLPSVAVDPDWASVVLLAHMDGSNGSTTFIDSSSYARTLAASGGADLTTSEKHYGTAAGNFVADNRRVMTGSSADLQLSDGDYTLEASIYMTAAPTFAHVLGLENSGTIRMSLCRQASGSFGAFVGGAYPSNLLQTGISTGTWFKYALTYRKSDGFTKAFYNGVTIGSTTLLQPGLTTPELFFGKCTGGQAGNGVYLDEVRVTKGVIRYAADYTPTGPFPDS